MSRKTSPQPGVSPTFRLWIGLLVGAAWLLIAASLISFDPADAPSHYISPHNAQPSNWVGRFGAVVAFEAYYVLGAGVWITMAGSFAAIIAFCRHGRIDQPILRAAGLLLASVTVSVMFAHWTPSLAHRPEGAGGLLGIVLCDALALRFGPLGTTILLLVSFWIGMLLAADHLLREAWRRISAAILTAAPILNPAPVLAVAAPAVAGLSQFFSNISRSARRRFGFGRDRLGGLADDLEDFVDDDEQPDDTRTSPRARKAAERKARAQRDQGEPIDPDAGGLGGHHAFDPEAQADAVDPDEAPDEDDAPQPNARKRKARRNKAEDQGPHAVQPDDADQQADDIDDADEDDDDDDSAADAPGVAVQSKKFDPEALREKIRQMPINFAPRNDRSAPTPQREPDFSGYQFPGLDMLVEPETDFSAEVEQLVREQAVKLESALQEYRIEGEVVGIDTGPVITLYEIRLAPGTKVNRIAAVASDIARSLKSHNIRIVPNTAGKDTIGVEVPNLKKEKVRLKELMTANPGAATKLRLPMYLGKDASGNPLIQDLTAMPHMLIAGTTGSGKSVCMNSIIISFLYTKRPDELKLVLVDPKMVEMSMFKDIPHLMCPVVTEMAKAASILEWAVTKMDERYELLAEAQVRDIASYNALGWDEIKARMAPATEAEAARIPKKLPYMVFVIDELADLMMTNKEVEGHIVRIAQKARAVGLHLILATQRPQANVVTGLIKSNMPCRVSFKVASGMDSRIVLDQKGAELLLGYGDMLYLSPRSSKLTRAQGTLLEDSEIRQVVKHLKTTAVQSFEPQLVQIKSGGGVSDEPMERDELFEDAVRVVLQTQRGSVSLLQRRLAVGYSRASRLIEQIAEAGLLGDHKGSQAREVLFSLEEWEAMKAQAEEDAAVEVNGRVIDADSAEAAAAASRDADQQHDDPTRDQLDEDDDDFGDDEDADDDADDEQGEDEEADDEDWEWEEEEADEEGSDEGDEPGDEDDEYEYEYEEEEEEDSEDEDEDEDEEDEDEDDR